MSYGGVTDGSDGGAFVEYQTVLATPNKVPKYTSFPSDQVMLYFALAWFINNGKTNLYQLLAAKYHSDGSYGAASSLMRQSVINIDAFPIVNNSEYKKDTTSHETGHIWGLSKGSSDSNIHIDNNVHRMSHCNSDRCIMTYVRNRTDDIPELCIDCIYYIRNTINF